MNSNHLKDVFLQPRLHNMTCRQDGRQKVKRMQLIKSFQTCNMTSQKPYACSSAVNESHAPELHPAKHMRGEQNSHCTSSHFVRCPCMVKLTCTMLALYLLFFIKPDTCILSAATRFCVTMITHSEALHFAASVAFLINFMSSTFALVLSAPPPPHTHFAYS